MSPRRLFVFILIGAGLLWLLNVYHDIQWCGFSGCAPADISRIALVTPTPMPVISQFDSGWHYTFWIGLLLLFPVGPALIALAAMFRFLIVPAINERERIHYDPQTGLLPVVRRDVAPWWKRMAGHHEYDEMDGNHAMTPHRKVWSNGKMAVQTDTHGVPLSDQQRYSAGSWYVQGNVSKRGADGRAGRGPSRNEMLEKAGYFEHKAKIEEARAEMMTRRLEQKVEPKLLPPPVVIEPPLTIHEAIAQSTERSWIIGQATAVQPVEGFSGVGRLLTLDYRTTQAAIIGGTGSGKTESTAMHLIYYARQFGLHPIVLDGKEGIDWRPFDGVVEWHSMDAATIVGQVGQLTAIFNERWELLKSTGMSTIYKMTKDRPETLFILVEEFGAVQLDLKTQDKEAWKLLVSAVDRLFRLGRATGIVLCLIDQAPEKWSQQMRGNAKFSVCYKLKGGVANAFNEYHVDKLPPVGVFSQDNVFYQAWHTIEQLDIVGAFPVLKRRYLGEAPETLETVKNDAGNDRFSPVETIGNVETKGGDNEQILRIPPSLENAFLRFRKWDDFCAEFFKWHPEATQAQLRKVMARLDGREPESFKTEAFRYYHRYSPNGKIDKLKDDRPAWVEEKEQEDNGQ